MDASIRIEKRKTKTQITAISRLIRSSKTLILPVFDPFRECKIFPLEKHLRDFLLAALRPNAPHGLSTIVLATVLDAMGDASAAARAAASRIQAAWRGGPFDVAREVPMAYARPDLVVSGKHFILAFEFKRRFGVETIINNRPQSKRLRQSVLRYASERGIARDLTVAILMSPQGMRAQDAGVLRVSADSFFNRLDQKLGRYRRIPPDTSRLVRSFTDFLREN